MPLTLHALLERCEPQGDCLVFTGAKSSGGYGSVGGRINGKRGTRQAHRLVYEWTKGPIPEGMEVRHTCDNPPCCNPDHLLIGTRQDNIQDMLDRRRRTWPRLSVCRNDLHALDEDNTYVTPDGRRNCRACRREANRRAYAKRKAASCR